MTGPHLTQSRVQTPSSRVHYIISPGNSPGAAAPGISCSICDLQFFILVRIVQPLGLGRQLVFEEVHLLISSSLQPTFEAV